MTGTQNLCYNCFANCPEGQKTCPYCGYSRALDDRPFPMALPPGSLLNGQYIIGRVLGQGGFGITYLALDERLRLKVAIKEYLPEGMAVRMPDSTRVAAYSADQQVNFLYGSERFLDEARVLAKFAKNPNIVSVRNYFEENGTSYFVMDFLEGVSFKTYLDQNGGRIPWQRAMEILLPVLDALAPVHREGYIHRDVTPDNICLIGGGVKLLDFGSARYSLGNKSKSLDVILKAGYAPKEQYMRRGKQGPYTDIYSVAACFYTAVTGQLPPESLERMEKDELEPPSVRVPGLPPALEKALLKGLAVRQEDRWQSAQAFKEALLSAAQGMEAPPMDPPPQGEISAAPPTRSLTAPIFSPKPGRTDGPTQVARTLAPPAQPAQNESGKQKPPGKKRRWPALVTLCAAVCLALAFAGRGMGTPEEPPAPEAPLEPYRVTYAVPCKYDYVEVLIDGYARCQQDGKWGFLGRDGHYLVEPVYDSIAYYFEDYVIFSQGGRYGYLDREGNVAIPARYSNAFNFSEGAAAVGTADGRYFFIDKAGNELFGGASFRYASSFSEGYAAVVTQDGATMMDRDGVVAQTYYDKTRELSDGLSAVLVGEKWGYAGPDMELVIEPRFLTAGNFADGLATVEDEEGMYHIDRTGKRVDERIWDKTFDFSDGYATVFEDGFYGYQDKSGKVAIPPQFEDVWSFQEGLCPVKRDNRWFYIDRQGNPVLDDGWKEAYIFSGGFAKVKKGGFYGMIDREGNLVLPYEFDDLLFPSDGLVPVKRSNRWGYYLVEKTGSAPAAPQDESESDSAT